MTVSFTDHGTVGVATMLIEVCEERAKTDDEPGMEAFWKAEADRFRECLK